MCLPIQAEQTTKGIRTRSSSQPVSVGVCYQYNIDTASKTLNLDLYWGEGVTYLKILNKQDTLELLFSFREFLQFVKINMISFDKNLWTGNTRNMYLYF